MMSLSSASSFRWVKPSHMYSRVILTHMHICQHPQPMSLTQPCMSCYVSSISLFLCLWNIHRLIDVCACTYTCMHIYTGTYIHEDQCVANTDIQTLMFRKCFETFSAVIPFFKVRFMCIYIWEDMSWHELPSGTREWQVNLTHCSYLRIWKWNSSQVLTVSNLIGF